MNFDNNVTEIARKSTMCQERERKLNFDNEIIEILVLPKLNGVLERENNCGNQVAENEGKKMLRPQHFYIIFTTNYMWLIVIGSNLNLTLRSRFCPNNNNQ